MGEHSSVKWPTLIMVKRNLNKRFAIIEEHTSRPVNLMETFPIYHMRIGILSIGLESMVYTFPFLCAAQVLSNSKTFFMKTRKKTPKEMSKV